MLNVTKREAIFIMCVDFYYSVCLSYTLLGADNKYAPVVILLLTYSSPESFRATADVKSDESRSGEHQFCDRL